MSACGALLSVELKGLLSQNIDRIVRLIKVLYISSVDLPELNTSRAKASDKEVESGEKTA